MDKKELQQLKWVYYSARCRCNNPQDKQYPNYGGRGIKFLFNSFEEFIDHLGERPNGYQLERINNEGNYEKGNVKWATFSEQQKNKRIPTSNVSGVKGVNFISTIKEWVARCNVDSNGYRRYLYQGNDFFEAVCARKSYEQNGYYINKRGTLIA